MYGSRHYFEIGYFSDMGLDRGFKAVYTCRPIGIGSDFFSGCIFGFGHFGDKGDYVAEEFHHTSYSHIA